MDAEPTDINELFSRNPMELSNADVDKIIMEFRKRRNIFNAAPATAAAKAPKVTAKEKAVSGLNLGIDI